MEYKKILRDKYNIHIINTDRFKTISLSIVFSNEFKNEDISYMSLLTKFLVSSTKKYKTSSELAIQGEELYGAEISASCGSIGNIERIIFTLDFLNPKYTEESMLKESIEFLNECLYNPNAKDNLFDENKFDIIKTNFISSIKSIKENPEQYAFIMFKNEMYKGFSKSQSLYNDIDLVEKIDSKKLYSFYLKMISEFKIDIFLNGNIQNEEEYIKYIDKIFDKHKTKFNKKLDFECGNIKSNKNEIKETRKINQSQLFMGYIFNNISDYEKKYVLKVYNGILGTANNSLLFTEIRENNSLCYMINSFTTPYPVSLVIETEIDKSNYLKAIKLVNKVIKMMSDKNKISLLFNTVKEQIQTSLNNFYDNVFSMNDLYYTKEFRESDDIEVRRQKFMDVTLDDVIELSKKIENNVIYFLEGDNHE